LKTLTNSKNCSENRIKFSIPAFLALIGHILSSFTFIAGFRNSFPDLRRLSEQLLESQAVMQ
jgi:hypothetical protein